MHFRRRTRMFPRSISAQYNASLIPFLTQATQAAAGRARIRKRRVRTAPFLQHCLALSRHGASNKITTGGAHFYAGMV